MAEEKKVAPKKEKKEELKAKYTVMVTGFHFKGQMFRSGKVIETKTYKDFIPQWLEEGKIK